MYQAPSYSSSLSDYYLFRFLEKFMSMSTMPYINTNEQYNYLYSKLGNIPGLYSHNAYYQPSKNSGVFIHLLKTHPMTVSFAGAAVIKSMNRASKEMIPKEIERTRKEVFCDLLMEKSPEKECEERNEEIRSGKKRRDFVEFVANLNEEYACNRIAS